MSNHTSGRCSCCDDGNSLDLSNMNIIITIQDDTYKATGGPTTTVLCHNGVPVSFKTWKDGLKDLGVSLSFILLDGIEQNYEDTISSLIQSNQTCS